MGPMESIRASSWRQRALVCGALVALVAVSMVARVAFADSDPDPAVSAERELDAPAATTPPTTPPTTNPPATSRTVSPAEVPTTAVATTAPATTMAPRPLISDVGFDAMVRSTPMDVQVDFLATASTTGAGGVSSERALKAGWYACDILARTDGDLVTAGRKVESLGVKKESEVTAIVGAAVLHFCPPA